MQLFRNSEPRKNERKNVAARGTREATDHRGDSVGDMSRSRGRMRTKERSDRLYHGPISRKWVDAVQAITIR